MTFSQCSATISTFPYNQGFELNNGDWSPGNSLHWEWGTPTGKIVIPGAATGAKCWIAGRLVSTSYESGSSELLSPCFDFSSLQHPEISFKVFWETERQFDGATLLYSTDNAASWNLVGIGNSNNTCQQIENWFNASSINFLNGAAGWSGNVQSGGGNCLSGNGSGVWVTARHNLENLAGQANVIFKFVFGAGTICNGYDGFAFDDFFIGESAQNSAAFTYTCSANATVNFLAVPAPCQVSWNWDFGDPASGSLNYSTEQNPVHVFSTAGTYTVNLSIGYSTGAAGSSSPQVLNIPDITAAVTEISCNGSGDGAISLNASPPGTYSFFWNTSATSSAIFNLSGGVYTAVISSPGNCAVTLPVILSEPAILTATPVLNNARCGNANGSISVNVSGGTQPYTYLWSTGSTAASIQNLTAGIYALTVSDRNGCSLPVFSNMELESIEYSLTPRLGKDTVICPGQSLILNAGSYTTYLWQDNSTASALNVTQTGLYFITVTDEYGCMGIDSISVTVDCKGIHFPTAFTPGNDNLNTKFGPLGDLGSLKNYRLTIYNRYAELIYQSSDPFSGWDGLISGRAVEMGNYVWVCTYTRNSEKVTSRKGSILVLR